MRSGKEELMVRLFKKELAAGRRAAYCVGSEAERERMIKTYGLPPGSVFAPDAIQSEDMSPLPGGLEYFDLEGLRHG